MDKKDSKVTDTGKFYRTRDVVVADKRKIFDQHRQSVAEDIILASMARLRVLSNYYRGPATVFKRKRDQDAFM